LSEERLAKFRTDYSRALKGYLDDPSESRLESAYELGRESFAQGLTILDIAASHHGALAEALGPNHSAQETKARADAAGTFLLESLSTYEMTQRGLQEAQETARLEREHAEALSGLSDAAVAITTARNPTELVELVTKHARTLVGAARGHVLLTPPQDPGRSPTDEQGPTSPEPDSLLNDPELLSLALGSTRPIRFDKSALERAAIPTTKQASAARSWLAAPLTSRDGRRFGVIELVDKHEGEFNENDEAIVTQLAQMVSVALENALLYEREHRIAHTLQQSLLPERLPEVPGVELAARFRAAGEGYEVGGDFYDVFEVEGGWMAIIGDVCGKGPPAAAITALVRYTARATALREQSPSHILATVNKALRTQVGDWRFCTVACGRLSRDGANVSMRLALGGHPRPFIRRRDGALSGVGRLGTALGITDEPELEEETVTLDPGDMAIFYTDGLIESPPIRAWTAADFQSLLKAATPPAPEVVAESLENAVVSLDGPRPRDDIAILVMGVRETGPRF
jgi:serine phosphatase RsbU (regulator of sigma subunit)